MSSLHVHYVSRAGRDKLQAALADAVDAYQEICRQRQLAFELSGDGWHDNPHFNHLQQLEANGTHKIAELRELLARTQIFEVADGKRPTDRARLGSIAYIEVSNLATGQLSTRVIEIVGFQEGDESGARVSYDAPLAKVLLGKRPGDVVETHLPGGRVEIELVELFESEAAAQSVSR
jgi:transcription elongation factor GreA